MKVGNKKLDCKRCYRFTDEEIIYMLENEPTYKIEVVNSRGLYEYTIWELEDGYFIKKRNAEDKVRLEKEKKDSIDYINDWVLRGSYWYNVQKIA